MARAGNTTARDVENAQHRLQVVQSEYNSRRRALRRLQLSQATAYSKCRNSQLLLEVRQWFDHSTSRIGGMLILVTLGGASGVVLTHLFGATLSTYSITVPIALIASALVSTILTQYPSDYEL